MNRPSSKTSYCTERRAIGTKPKIRNQVRNGGRLPGSFGVMRSSNDGRVIRANGQTSLLAPLTLATRSHTSSGGAFSVETNSTTIGIATASTSRRLQSSLAAGMDGVSELVSELEPPVCFDEDRQVVSTGGCVRSSPAAWAEQSEALLCAPAPKAEMGVGG